MSPLLTTHWSKPAIQPLPASRSREKQFHQSCLGNRTDGDHSPACKGARELVHPHPSKYKSDGKLAGAFSHSWTSQLPAGVGWAEPHSPSQGLYGIIGVQVRIELNSRNKSYVFPDDRQVAPWLLMEVQCQMSNSRGCCPVVYRVLKWLWMGDSPLSGGAGFLISDSDQP